MPRRAILIYNPTSGRQVATRTLPRLVETLGAGGFEVEPRATQGPGDATRLARECTEAGDIEVAFALGGDGTLREVAKGLLGSDVALGPLPAGTANVLAYAFDLPRTPIAAAHALAAGRIRTMDVGLANDEPFLMMVSAGLDAAVMARQSPKWKRLFGPAAIVGSGLGQWWTYDYPEIAVRLGGHVDGQLDEQRIEGSFVALCNIPHYGGSYRLAPEASIDDGLLDLVCFQGRGALPSLGFGLSMVRGRLGERSDVRTARVREAEILGPLPHGLQIDGDVIGLEPPIRVGIRPGSLRVLAPR